MCAASSAAIHMPRARMEVRGSSPIHGHVLKARCCTLVFLIPSHRPLRHLSPSTFLRLQQPHGRDFQLPIDLCSDPSAEFDIHQAG
jgi:hypothetical protein